MTTNAAWCVGCGVWGVGCGVCLGAIRSGLVKSPLHTLGHRVAQLAQEDDDNKLTLDDTRMIIDEVELSST